MSLELVIEFLRSHQLAETELVLLKELAEKERQKSTNVEVEEALSLSSILNQKKSLYQQLDSDEEEYFDEDTFEEKYNSDSNHNSHEVMNDIYDQDAVDTRKGYEKEISRVVQQIVETVTYIAEQNTMDDSDHSDAVEEEHNQLNDEYINNKDIYIEGKEDSNDSDTESVVSDETEDENIIEEDVQALSERLSQVEKRVYKTFDYYSFTQQVIHDIDEWENDEDELGYYLVPAIRGVDDIYEYANAEDEYPDQERENASTSDDDFSDDAYEDSENTHNRDAIFDLYPNNYLEIEKHRLHMNPEPFEENDQESIEASVNSRNEESLVDDSLVDDSLVDDSNTVVDNSDDEDTREEENDHVEVENNKVSTTKEDYNVLSDTSENICDSQHEVSDKSIALVVGDESETLTVEEDLGEREVVENSENSFTEQILDSNFEVAENIQQTENCNNSNFLDEEHPTKEGHKMEHDIDAANEKLEYHEHSFESETKVDVEELDILTPINNDMEQHFPESLNVADREILKNTYMVNDSESVGSMENSEDGDEDEVDEENEGDDPDDYVEDDVAGDTLEVSTDENITEDEEEPTHQIDSPKRHRKSVFETLYLPVIHEKYKTGFEVEKEFPIEINSIIAGRYLIQEYLGSAAFSNAVQCLDLHTKELVCIKIIKNNKDYFDQSLDEIKLLRYINSHGDPDEHHVVRLYEFFYHKEHLFLVCELLKDNLYEYSKHNRENEDEFYFTIPRLQRITTQILKGLQFIHSLDLIHCDLKPENILIRSYSNCEVKIIDFGSSCFTYDSLCQYVQSRTYRAPEVILGLPYNELIDVWSLGCIVAELWTGVVLFSNSSIQTMLAKIIAICGDIPEHMLRNGPFTRKFFTREGVLYRMKKKSKINFIIPKKTNLRARLNCNDELFIDFVASCLIIDPTKRPSIAECMRHPFITSRSYRIT